MNARDELAAIIQSEYTRAIDRKRPADCFAAPADAILAAGYRKPRTITTAEELDALPCGFVVREPLGLIWEKTGHVVRGTFWIETGDEQEYQAKDIGLPVTVLYEPGQS